MLSNEILPNEIICTPNGKQTQMKRKIVTDEMIITTERERDMIISKLKHGTLLRDVDDKFRRDYDVCSAAIQHDPINLTWVSLKHLRSRYGPLALEAVKKNGYMITHVPKSLMTIEMAIHAVNWNRTFRHIPKSFLSHKGFVLSVISNTGRLLKYIPHFNHDKTIVRAAINSPFSFLTIKNYNDGFASIKYANGEMQLDLQFVLEAVKIHYIHRYKHPRKYVECTEESYIDAYGSTDDEEDPHRKFVNERLWYLHPLVRHNKRVWMVYNGKPDIYQNEIGNLFNIYFHW